MEKVENRKGKKTGNTSVSKETQVFHFMKDKDYTAKSNSVTQKDEKSLNAIKKENANEVNKQESPNLKKYNDYQKNSNANKNNANNNEKKYNNYQEKNSGIKKYNNYQEKNNNGKINKKNNAKNIVENNIKISKEDKTDNRLENKIESKVINSTSKNTESKAINSTANKVENKVITKTENKTLNNVENKTTNKTRQKTKKVLIVFFIIIIFVLFATIFSTIFALSTIKNSNIIKGVRINNIEVSGLTKEQSINALENELNNNEKNYITVRYNDFSKKIYLQDIDGKFDVKESVETAYKLGRESNFITNNYKILGIMFLGKNINAGFSYNDELLEKVIDNISLEISGIATESSYIIDADNLIIKNIKEGLQIQSDVFKQNVVRTFVEGSGEFQIQVKEVPKKEIDIEKIHSEIYKNPVNAHYTTNPHVIYKEEDGLDFAISLSDAKRILAEDKDEYVIKLKTVKPQITVADLDSGAYPDVLSSFTTKYGTADRNRNTNIALATRSINSVVLMPGETFSYNDLIGECSIRTGYKAATIYLNGELSTGVGGGICQVSTTLYNAVLRANLEIVERRNHSLGVTYAPAGQDAMVSIGSQDFKFKNNRNYPIKVVAYVGTGSVTCQIRGLKQDTEYDIKLYSRTISKTETKHKVETYKILYLNGKEVSRTWLSTDTYKFH